MSAKDKQSSPTAATGATKIRRITATDNTSPSTARPAAKQDDQAPTRTARLRKNPLRSISKPFVAILGYFKGAWFELRQVHWPNRRATWGMTGALLGFVAFFVAFILLSDALFQYLFKLMLG